MCVHHSCYVYRGCTGDVGVGRLARCRSGWAFAAKVPGLLGSLQECPTSLNLRTFSVLKGLAISDVFVPPLPCLDVLVLAPDYFSRERGIACHLSQFKVVISKDFVCVRRCKRGLPDGLRWTVRCCGIELQARHVHH